MGAAYQRSAPCEAPGDPAGTCPHLLGPGLAGGAVGCVASCLGLPSGPSQSSCLPAVVWGLQSPLVPWGASKEAGGTGQGLTERGLCGAGGGGALMPERLFLGVRLLGPDVGPACRGPAACVSLLAWLPRWGPPPRPLLCHTCIPASFWVDVCGSAGSRVTGTVSSALGVMPARPLVQTFIITRLRVSLLEAPGSPATCRVPTKPTP